MNRYTLTFYGDKERYFSSEFKIRGDIGTRDNESAMTYVRNTREWLEFTDKVEHVRALMKEINDMSVPVSVKLQRLRREWIPITEEYVEVYGLHMVLHDIRRAISGVRRELNIAGVIWPKIHMVHVECGLITPGHVDDYGKAIVDNDGSTGPDNKVTYARMRSPE